MDRQRIILRLILFIFLFVLTAGVFRFWVGPLVELLPTDYASETFYTAEARFRESPTGEWTETPLIARRVDQSFSSIGNVLIIQGELHWTTPDGVATFETSGLYGVDRQTRANLPGFGNLDRTGQFLFAPQLQPATYDFWDPFYSGSRVATFDHIETIDGMEVYKFQFSGTGFDDTSASEYLPNVPERYSVVSQGQGHLWIEPISGVVVDLEDSGVSSFVEPETHTYVAAMYFWNDQYTAETKTAQLQLARQLRQNILLVKIWIPAALLLISGLLLAWTLRVALKAAPKAEGVGGTP